MKQFNFKLVTPDKIVFDEKVSETIIPTPNGKIGVLAGHEPLVTLLAPGEIEIKNEKETIHLASMGGFATINQNQVTVLSDSAVRSEEIDALAAEEAKVKAEQAMQKAHNDIEIAEATSSLEKALLHLKIANRKHKHH